MSKSSHLKRGDGLDVLAALNLPNKHAEHPEEAVIKHIIDMEMFFYSSECQICVMSSPLIPVKLKLKKESIRPLMPK